MAFALQNSDTVVCPGPNPSVCDRSLSMKVDPSASDRFTVFSHAGSGKEGEPSKIMLGPRYKPTPDVGLTAIEV